MVNKKLHSVWDKSEVLEEDSRFSFSKSLKSTPIWEVEKWTKNKSKLSTTSCKDQPSTTSQNGSWIDKRTQRTEPGPNSFPISSIPTWERISREWESQRTTEVLDTSMDLELEVKELSPLVDAVRHLVLPERRSDLVSFR